MQRSSRISDPIHLFERRCGWVGDQYLRRCTDEASNGIADDVSAVRCFSLLEALVGRPQFESAIEGAGHNVLSI